MPCRQLSLDEDGQAQQSEMADIQLPFREASRDSRGNDMEKEASLPDQSKGQLQEENVATATEPKAEGETHSQRNEFEVGREHPSNHEWISDTAQRILLEDEPSARDEADPTSAKQAAAEEERVANSRPTQHTDTSEAMDGSMQRSEDGSIDPEVLASLPPEIQREVKLASMMRMGSLKKPPQQQLHHKPVNKPQIAAPKQKKKKGANIANYFSAK